MSRRGGTNDWRRPAALLAAVVTVAAGVWAWRARATVPERDVVAAARPATHEPTPAPSADPDPAQQAKRTPSNVVVPYVAPPKPKAVAAIGAQAAAEYRRRARYPRWAQPLGPDDPDPLVRDREISPVESRGPNGAEPVLRVFPAAMGFESPEPAIVFAELTTRGRPVVAREVRGTLTTENLEPLADVLFHDDGLDGDAVAGDGRYTVVFAGDALGGKLSTSYLVQVQALLGGDDERKGATSFQYASPDAQLTGNYRDALVDGSLVVGVEIDVTEAGRFHVEATLYGAGGTEKIAWAQAAQVLEPGTHWLDLSYYGLILRERGIDGPYVLRYVALSTTTEMPNAKNRVAENPYQTAAYDVSAFSDRVYDDPQLLEAAERIEQDPMPAGLDAGG
jgi:hypothetical protein